MSKLCEKDFELYRGILVEPKRMNSLVRTCTNMEQLALLMREHHEYIERSGYDYGEEVFELINQQIMLMIKDKGEENRQFLCLYIDDFYTFKKQKNSGAKWTRID